jgi:hypothetical protein
MRTAAQVTPAPLPESPAAALESPDFMAKNAEKTAFFGAFPGQEPPCFEFPNEEEREVFGDICDYLAERAAILEYEEGWTSEAADAEAERRAMDRYPPSPTARAAILEHAERLAAFHGITDWRAAEHLGESRVRRLHVNHGHWTELREYFERKRAGALERPRR